MPIRIHSHPVIRFGKRDIEISRIVDRGDQSVGVAFSQLTKRAIAFGPMYPDQDSRIPNGHTAVSLVFTNREAIDVLISCLVGLRGELPENPKVESTSKEWVLVGQYVEWRMAVETAPESEEMAPEAPSPVPIDAEVAAGPESDTEVTMPLADVVKVVDAAITQGIETIEALQQFGAPASAVSDASVSRHLHEDLGPQEALLAEFTTATEPTVSYRIVAHGPNRRVDYSVHGSPWEDLLGTFNSSRTESYLALYDLMADRIEEARES
mgnify:CR=1 FL=1